MITKDNVEALELLLECSRVFLDYSEIHRNKHGEDSEQYKRNFGMFMKCREYLDRTCFEKLENFPTFGEVDG